MHKLARMTIGVAGLTYSYLATGSVQAPDSTRIPDEYESAGGHSLAFGNGGAAALTGVSAIRVNPAMMALQRDYTVSLGYHWPSYGRDFYQGGVVDSQTSSVAAGVLYTGFNDKIEDSWKDEEFPFDTPVAKRMSFGMSKVTNKAAIGLSGHFIQAMEREGSSYRRKKGVTLGFGVAGLLTKNLRFGLSVENFSNKKMKQYAPQTYRAGVALMLADGDVTLQLDLRRRERVEGFETNLTSDHYGLVAVEQIKGKLSSPEDMAFTSFSSRVYDLLRVIGSYGVSVSGKDHRKSASGGLAIVQDRFSLSYNVSKPYLSDSEVQTNININFGVSM